MTESDAQTNETNSLTSSQVSDYLGSHPDFFQQHRDLLLKMDVLDHKAGSISLVERQLKGLRERNNELADEIQQVIRNAQDNQQLLQQTIKLTLSLITAETISQLVEILYGEMKHLFDINYHNLLLNQDLFDESAYDLKTIRSTLGDNFPIKQPVCGRLKSSEKQCLFNLSDAEQDKVKSAAILPLGDQGELGLLVMGSEDPAHFDPAMGDLFLLLIADLLSKFVYRFGNTTD